MVQVKIYFSKRQIMGLKQKRHLTLAILGGNFYEVQKKSTGYMMGILVEWRKLVPKVEGYLMPFIVCRTSRRCIDIGITRKKMFLMPPRELRAQTKEGILKNYKYLDRFVLTAANTKQLQAMYPGFCFTFLEKFVRLPHIRHIDFFG